MLEIARFLLENQDAMLRDLEEVVKADSPSHSKEAVDQCGKVVQGLFAGHLGLRAEIIPQAKTGNHLKFTFGAGPEQILILGHIDTVWDVGRLSYRKEENRIYGPGVLDMKGGIVQAIWAIKALSLIKGKLDKRIVFLLNSDEELGSLTSRSLIEEEAKRSKFVLVPEPAESGTGALKTARKGVGIFKLKVRGLAAHAGNHHALGISAIHELAHQILALQDLTDYKSGTTVNVGVIKGGTRSNVVAGEAEAEIDVRITSQAEAQRIEHVIRGLQPELPGCTITIEGGINRPPLERTPAIGEMFKLARKIAFTLGFKLEEAAVGGASDGNFTAAMNIPTLDGLGCVGEDPHAENEHLVISHLRPRTALFANLVFQLCQR